MHILLDVCPHRWLRMTSESLALSNILGQISWYNQDFNWWPLTLWSALCHWVKLPSHHIVVCTIKNNPSSTITSDSQRKYIRSFLTALLLRIILAAITLKLYMFSRNKKETFESLRESLNKFKVFSFMNHWFWLLKQTLLLMGNAV